MGNIAFISHRGNVAGPEPARENHPDYIDAAIKVAHLVEVDLRRIGDDFYLGHDYPQYKIDEDWLTSREDNLLLHVKDIDALKHCRSTWHVFSHTNDPFTITTFGCLWLHDLHLEPNEHAIVPLLTRELVLSYPKQKALYAICSDWQVDKDGDLVKRKQM